MCKCAQIISVLWHRQSCMLQLFDQSDKLMFCLRYFINNYSYRWWKFRSQNPKTSSALKHKLRPAPSFSCWILWRKLPLYYNPSSRFKGQGKWKYRIQLGEHTINYTWYNSKTAKTTYIHLFSQSYWPGDFGVFLCRWWYRESWFNLWSWN
jgi:hypothetical protein